MLTDHSVGSAVLRSAAPLLAELQAARSVSDLRRFVRRLRWTVPADYLATRTRADRQDGMSGLLPLWTYPTSATLQWDDGSDFIIQLSNGTLARWDAAEESWKTCSRSELLWRQFRARWL